MSIPLKLFLATSLDFLDGIKCFPQQEENSLGRGLGTSLSILVKSFRIKILSREDSQICTLTFCGHCFTFYDIRRLF